MIIKIKQELEKRWRDTKDAQAKYYNKHYKLIEYNVGELVLLSSKNISTTQPSKKLGACRLRPFEVLERISS